MELFTLMLGMLLSFIAGAYVRQPFALTKEDTKPQQPMLDTIKEEEAHEYMKQMNILWNYSEKDALNGTTNTEED